MSHWKRNEGLRKRAMGSFPDLKLILFFPLVGIYFTLFWEWENALLFCFKNFILFWVLWCLFWFCFCSFFVGFFFACFVDFFGWDFLFMSVFVVILFCFLFLFCFCLNQIDLTLASQMCSDKMPLAREHFQYNHIFLILRGEFLELEAEMCLICLLDQK